MVRTKLVIRTARSRVAVRAKAACPGPSCHAPWSVHRSGDCASLQWRQEDHPLFDGAIAVALESTEEIADHQVGYLLLASHDLGQGQVLFEQQFNRCGLPPLARALDRLRTSRQPGLELIKVGLLAPLQGLVVVPDTHEQHDLALDGDHHPILVVDVHEPELGIRVPFDPPGVERRVVRAVGSDEIASAVDLAGDRYRQRRVVVVERAQVLKGQVCP
jgi:hypothetical protein